MRTDLFVFIGLLFLGASSVSFAQIPEPLDEAERIASEKMLAAGRLAKACTSTEPQGPAGSPAFKAWVQQRQTCGPLMREWSRLIDARDAARDAAERRLAAGGGQRLSEPSRQTTTPSRQTTTPSRQTVSQTGSNGGTCVTVNRSGQNCVTCQTEFKACSQNKREHPILKQCTYKNLVCTNICGSSSPIQVEFEYLARDYNVPGEAVNHRVVQLDPENVKTRGDILRVAPYCKR